MRLSAATLHAETEIITVLRPSGNCRSPHGSRAHERCMSASAKSGATAEESAVECRQDRGGVVGVAGRQCICVVGASALSSRRCRAISSLQLLSRASSACSGAAAGGACGGALQQPRHPAAAGCLAASLWAGRRPRRYSRCAFLSNSSIRNLRFNLSFAAAADRLAAGRWAGRRPRRNSRCAV